MPPDHADSFRMIQFLTADIENPVEPSPVILECELPRELQQLLFGELISQRGIQIVGYIGGRRHHGIRQLDYEQLGFIEHRQIIPTDGEQFLIG
jgi:hypothetical protein